MTSQDRLQELIELANQVVSNDLLKEILKAIEALSITALTELESMRIRVERMESEILKLKTTERSRYQIGDKYSWEKTYQDLRKSLLEEMAKKKDNRPWTSITGS